MFVCYSRDVFHNLIEYCATKNVCKCILCSQGRGRGSVTNLITIVHCSTRSRFDKFAEGWRPTAIYQNQERSSPLAYFCD